MSLNNFMGNVWSECLHQQMNKRYVGVANCDHYYAQDIKGGATLKVCGLNPVTINDYTPNTDIPAPQELSDFAKILTADQSKYFNFQIDDIEKAQTDANVMKMALDNATNGLVDAADKHVFRQYVDAGHTFMPGTVDQGSILDILISARSSLFESSVSNPADIVIEVSPTVANMIFRAKLDLLTDNSALLESGYIGTFLGSKIYVSPNIVSEFSGDVGTNLQHCLMRTRRSIAFLDCFSEIIAYRPENRFSDAIKGLYFYGAKVVYPKEVIDIAIPEM